MFNEQFNKSIEKMTLKKNKLGKKISDFVMSIPENVMQDINLSCKFYEEEMKQKGYIKKRLANKLYKFYDDFYYEINREGNLILSSYDKNGFIKESLEVFPFGHFREDEDYDRFELGCFCESLDIEDVTVQKLEKNNVDLAQVSCLENLIIYNKKPGSCFVSSFRSFKNYVNSKKNNNIKNSANEIDGSLSQ